MFRCGLDSQTHTRRSGSAKGSGFMSTACTALKMAALAPMATASVSTAADEKPRRRASARAASLTSWISHSIADLPGLFRTQRQDRRDPGGAEGGHGRRRQGDEQQERGGGGVGGEVRR